MQRSKRMGVLRNTDKKERAQWLASCYGQQLAAPNALAKCDLFVGLCMSHFAFGFVERISDHLKQVVKTFHAIASVSALGFVINVALLGNRSFPV